MVGTKGIIGIVAIFTAVLIIGFVIASYAVKTGSIPVLYSSLSNPQFIYFSYFVYATLALIILLLILRRHRHHSNTLLFELLEGVVVSFTSFFAFLLIAAILAPAHVSDGWAYIAAGAIAIGIVIVKDLHPQLKDFATIASSLGVGVLLGFDFQFRYALILFAAVAVYDYIGVFRSREMITLAKAFAESNVAFLLSISDLEAVPVGKYSTAEVEEYINYLHRTHGLDDPKFKKIMREGKLPVISRISLGEGDLGLPLMLVISAYYTFTGVQLISLMALLGGVMGMIATMLILRRYKHPLPAIPPLFAFMSIFTGIAFLATGTLPAQLTVLILAVGATVMLIDMLTILVRMHPKQAAKTAGRYSKA